MKVKVGKIPGRTQVVELNEGATIADALKAADLSVSGYELRLSGTVTEDFNKEVKDGDMVLLAQKIKGNSDDYDEDDWDDEEDDETEDKEWGYDDEVKVVELNGEEYVMGKYATVEDLLLESEDTKDLDFEEIVVTETDESGEVQCEYIGTSDEFDSVDLVDGHKYKVSQNVVVEDKGEECCCSSCSCENFNVSEDGKVVVNGANVVYESDKVTVEVSDNTVTVVTKNSKVTVNI